MTDPIRKAYLAQLAEILAGSVSRDEFWRFSDAYERGRAAAWRHGQKISIPTDSMEQEFQNYHRMGYNKGRADLLAEQQAHPPAQPERGERALRQLLALWYSGPGLLYTDDGELQDNSKHPCIDFLRDSPETLAEKMRERAQPAITDARVAQLEAALRSLIAVTADGNTSRVVGMMLDNARALLERK